MREIILTKGRVALVDDADYEWLNQMSWHANRRSFRSNNTFYARRAVWREGIREVIHMHRLILGLKHGDKRQCDHIDGDGLNNQRSNLRPCTNMQNQRNRTSVRHTASKFKGVSLCKGNRWRARISLRAYKQIHLGYFDTESDAARAYDAVAIKHFGEFARINFALPPIKTIVDKQKGGE